MYGIILPIDELQHFSRWLAITTNQIIIIIKYHCWLPL
jgi:hypothetical protein